MKHSASPPPRQKYPPLTAAQQRLVLDYRKIAADYARRMARSYGRLVSGDDAESIAMLALCQAAQRFDSRGRCVWVLAKLRIRQRVFEAIDDAMVRARSRCSTNPLTRHESPQATPAERAALRTILAWVEEDPTRAETIDRAIIGGDLTPDDLDRLESLRDELGMVTPAVVDVATAAQRLGRSPKALRGALTRGTVPGYRCGATWRVFLGAALRCAA